MKLLPARIQTADRDREPYAVVQATDKPGVFEIVESQLTEKRALHAMRILQTHSDAHGGSARYEVVRKPQPVRYAITNVGTTGRRIYTLGRQARWTWATRDEALRYLDAMKGNPLNNLPGVHGPQAAGTYRVEAICCWPNTLDPAQEPDQD